MTVRRTPAPTSSGRRTGLIVALVALVVLAVAGAGVAYAVPATTTVSRRPTRRASRAPASRAESPTETGTESPTTAPPDTEAYTPQPGDEDKAVVGAHRGAPGPGGRSTRARPAAWPRSWSRTSGVPRMVEAGMLTADLEINNNPMSGGLPSDVQTAVFSAAFDCALSTRHAVADGRGSAHHLGATRVQDRVGAAVDEQHRADDEARGVGEQEADRSRRSPPGGPAGRARSGRRRRTVRTPGPPAAARSSAWRSCRAPRR